MARAGARQRLSPPRDPQARPRSRGSDESRCAGGRQILIARCAAVLGLYAGLVVWLTWPLAASLRTHLPGTYLAFDTLHTAWVLSWETHALTTAPLSLPTANIYHPTPHALFYGQTAFGALPYFAPTFLATGNPALALNLLFLSGIALSACALHGVAWRWTGSHLAGFVAAWSFMTTRWVPWELGPSAPQYALLHYLPVIVLLAATPARRFPFDLLALVVLQALVDVVYLAAAVLAPLTLLALARMTRRATRAAGLRLVAVVAVGALTILPALAGHLLVRFDNPNLDAQTVWTLGQNPIVLPWGLISNGAATALPSAMLVLIVAGVASLAVAGRTAPALHAWAHAALWAVAGTVMSLIPVPPSHAAAVLETWLPFVEVLRVPARLGAAALVGLSLLAGLAFVECARRLAPVGRFLPTVLAAMVVFAAHAEYRHGLANRRFARPPLPTSYPTMPVLVGEGPVLRRLRQGDGPLLELPVGEGPSSAIVHARAMYRSIFHWRPLLNGYTGYWPAPFRDRMALARRLPDPHALRALHDATGLELILVNMADLTDEKQAAWTALADRDGRDDLHLLEREGPDLLFAVRE